MQENSQKVLIVEDDRDLHELLKIHLQDIGCETTFAEDGASGLEIALTGEFDLILLDLMLPRLNGLEVCKKIRQAKITTPILMLTAKSEELDKVLGLELGADDYLTKPFSVRELIARVKAIFRRVEDEQQRNKSQESPTTVAFGKFQIDLTKRQARFGSEKLELTAKEFDLLTLFVSNPGHTYTRQELLEQVWGYQFSGYDHTVNSHINRLRNKIEKDPANPQYIKTLWGVGYRFIDQEELSG